MTEENKKSLPHPRTGQKPNYLQQEVLDKAIEDGGEETYGENET